MGKRVKSQWIGGNLVFMDDQGNVIVTFDGVNQRFNFPAAGLLSIAGIPVTATAAQLNSASAAINVRNATGGDLDAGTLVYLSGWHAASNSPTIAVAGLTAQATHVLTEDIDNGENGLADEEALVGMDTDAFGVGDLLYLDAGGDITDTAPTGANEIAQVVGIVTTAAVDGEVLFFPGFPLVQRIGTSGVQDSAITINKLAGDANLSALIASGLGAVETFAHGAGDDNLLLAADPTDARACVVVAIVTTTLVAAAEFSVHADAAPGTEILAVPTLAAAGDVFVGAGNLPATEPLNVSATAGDDGEVMFLVLALPAA